MSWNCGRVVTALALCFTYVICQQPKSNEPPVRCEVTDVLALQCFQEAGGLLSSVQSGLCLDVCL